MGDDGDPDRALREFMEKLAAAADTPIPDWVKTLGERAAPEWVRQLGENAAMPEWMRQLRQPMPEHIKSALRESRRRSFLSSVAPAAAPAVKPAPEPAPPDPDPFRTGTGGRPSAAHVVLEEATRRITDKEIKPTQTGLSAFARDLAEWWEQKRPTYPEDLRPPELKAKHIAAIVRDLWRANITGPS